MEVIREPGHGTTPHTLGPPPSHEWPMPADTGHANVTWSNSSSTAKRPRERRDQTGSRKRDCERPCSQPQRERIAIYSGTPACRSRCLHYRDNHDGDLNVPVPPHENGRQRSGKAVTFHHPCLPTVKCLDFSPLKTDQRYHFALAVCQPFYAAHGCCVNCGDYLFNVVISDDRAPRPGVTPALREHASPAWQKEEASRLLRKLCLGSPQTPPYRKRHEQTPLSRPASCLVFLLSWLPLLRFRCPVQIAPRVCPSMTWSGRCFNCGKYVFWGRGAGYLRFSVTAAVWSWA